MNNNFEGNNDVERELNKQLYFTTLELDRYQDMTMEVLNYILENINSAIACDIYEIIKKWAC